MKNWHLIPALLPFLGLFGIAYGIICPRHIICTQAGPISSACNLPSEQQTYWHTPSSVNNANILSATIFQFQSVNAGVEEATTCWYSPVGARGSANEKIKLTGKRNFYPDISNENWSKHSVSSWVCPKAGTVTSSEACPMQSSNGER